MANLETLTIDGVSMDNFHPATLTTATTTRSIASGSAVEWNTGVTIPAGLSFVMGVFTFPASATGTRYAQFGTWLNGEWSQFSAMRVPACPSGETILLGYGSVKSVGAHTLGCRLFQNSGSTQTVKLVYSFRNFPTLLD